MGEWRETTLGSIATDDGYGLVDGPFGSNLPASCYTEEGVPVIRGSNLSLGSGRFSEVGFVFVSTETAKRLERSLCRPLDIVFTKKGTLGQTGLVPEHGTYNLYLLSSNQMKLTVNHQVADPLFIYYFVSSPDSVQKIIRDSEVTGVPKTNVTYLRKFPILLPPLDGQHAIASLLGTLDDKIELNRRMNQTLEAMARAIFKDWFVDFGPTRAKAEGRPPYLAPEIWSLFPDALDDEDKPQGWGWEPIGDHITVYKGLSYKGKGLRENGGMPLHNLNSVLEGGGYKVDGLKFYEGDFKPRHLAKPGDLIVANTEQGFDHLLIGFPARIPSWAGSEGLFSHHLFKLEPKSDSPLTKNWFYAALAASWIGERVRQFSNGTTVNMLPAAAFELPLIPIPKYDVIRTYDKLVEDIFSFQEELYEQSQTLAQTRDLLLPKLMSGEIRLGEVEKIAGEVA